MISKVLLAAKLDPDDPELAIRQLKNLRYPVMGSPKIDGIRCHLEENSLGMVALSRKNKAIPNHYVRTLLTSSRSWIGMDGELVVGKANTKVVFNNTQSGVMSRDGEPDFRFFTFDLTNQPKLTFEERFRMLEQRVPVMNKILKLVPHRYLYSYEELVKYEEMMVLKGWEGIMIRDPNGRYKEGRSTLNEGILIKVKRFEDSEAEILGCYEQETNHNPAKINEIGNSKRSSHKENKVANGRLGGFEVRDIHSGVQFRLGNLSGITLDQRRLMWIGFLSDPSQLLGKTIKYKSQPVGTKNKPRIPIYQGFRDQIDMGEPDAISN